MEHMTEHGQNNPDSMKTLTEITNKVVKEGYVENFSVKKSKLYAPSNDSYFTPENVSVVNFYRFEGASNPADMDILYVIETKDGQLLTSSSDDTVRIWDVFKLPVPGMSVWSVVHVCMSVVRCTV